LTMRLDVYSAYCIEATCNFILPRVVWIKLKGPDNLVRDYTIDMSSEARERILRGEAVTVEAVRASALATLSSSPTKAEIAALSAKPSASDIVGGIVLFLDADNRYELVVRYRDLILTPLSATPMPKSEDFIVDLERVAPKSHHHHHHAPASSTHHQKTAEYIAPSILASQPWMRQPQSRKHAPQHHSAAIPAAAPLTQNDVDKLREQLNQKRERLERTEKILQNRLQVIQRKKEQLKLAATQLESPSVNTATKPAAPAS
jgi:hypothetical protein